MQKPLTFLASAAIALTLALPVAAQDEPGLDTVVATVNGTEIKLGHMIIARASLPEQYQQLPDEVLFNFCKHPKAPRHEVKKRIVNLTLPRIRELILAPGVHPDVRAEARKFSRGR